MSEKQITINGVLYIRKDSITTATTNDLEYVIVRTYSAGVFAGYITKRNGQEGILINARRLWYWEGAASLSQLAMEGVKKPEKCRFPCEVNQIILTDIIEIISATEAARKSIRGVAIWEA